MDLLSGNILMSECSEFKESLEKILNRATSINDYYNSAADQIVEIETTLD